MSESTSKTEPTITAAKRREEAVDEAGSQFTWLAFWVLIWLVGVGIVIDYVVQANPDTPPADPGLVKIIEAFVIVAAWFCIPINQGMKAFLRFRYAQKDGDREVAVLAEREAAAKAATKMP